MNVLLVRLVSAAGESVDTSEQDGEAEKRLEERGDERGRRQEKVEKDGRGGCGQQDERGEAAADEVDRWAAAEADDERQWKGGGGGGQD